MSVVVVEVVEVSKRCSNMTVLEDVSLEVERGECSALWGPAGLVRRRFSKV